MSCNAPRARDAVAPLAGAWIETPVSIVHRCPKNVAPLAGAWIETCANIIEPKIAVVAPLAGAWIETTRFQEAALL